MASPGGATLQSSIAAAIAAIPLGGWLGATTASAADPSVERAAATFEATVAALGTAPQLERYGVGFKVASPFAPGASPAPYELDFAAVLDAGSSASSSPPTPEQRMDAFRAVLAEDAAAAAPAKPSSLASALEWVVGLLPGYDSLSRFSAVNLLTEV